MNDSDKPVEGRGGGSDRTFHAQEHARCETPFSSFPVRIDGALESTGREPDESEVSLALDRTVKSGYTL